MSLISLTPLEQAFFALTTSQYPQTIGIMCELDEGISLSFLKEAAKKAIKEIPRLAYLRAGKNWLLPNSCPEPPIFTQTGNNLWSVVSQVFNRSFNLGFWDIWVINKKYILFRCHHALGDGLGLRNLIVNYFCEGSTKRSFSRERLKAAKIVNYSELFKHLFKNRLGELDNAESFKLWGEDEQNYQNSNFEFIKRCLLENTKKQLRVVIPVNLRALGDETPLENNLSASCVEISKVENLAQDLKQIIGKVGFFYSLAKIGTILPASIRKIAALECALKTSFICTNVPISKSILTINNQKISRFYGFPALLPGNQVGYALMSYNGEKTFNRVTKSRDKFF